MIAQDVKLLCPAELRDTCMLLFHHMQKAFSGISFGQPKGPVRISTKQQQAAQAADGISPSGSPKINRSQSDGMQTSGTSLSRSSLGSVSALRRHGSSDAAPSMDAAGLAGGGSASGSSTNVNTPAEENRMLQTILGQNAAAAAAAAAADRKRAAARARELQAKSGSNGSVSTGGASIAPTDSFISSVDSSLTAGAVAGPDGLGHAAAAARALRGVPAVALAGGSSSHGADEEGGVHDSPHSAAMSDLSQLSHATNSSALGAAGGAGSSAAAEQQQQGGTSGGGGLIEQMLLEYEIEFVQVQVSG